MRRKHRDLGERKVSKRVWEMYESREAWRSAVEFSWWKAIR